MGKPKMLILRGNNSGPGMFPDEQGNLIDWPIGALHVQAATIYAQKRGYEAVVLDKPGRPQGKDSPQSQAALKAFLDPNDQTVAAFYGFSGGGYNVKHILDYLAENEPQSMNRITLIVVLGAPPSDKHDGKSHHQDGKSRYLPSVYNALARQNTKRTGWKDADWELVYRENPDPSQLPPGLPKGTTTHMFGPDVLLSGWPE
jgi:hypothetical protein